jgi:hypothetical protein
MREILNSISRVLSGAARAFKTFPAAVGCAGGFSAVTLVRIFLDWPRNDAYNFLFSCLHWAFALGAILGLAALTCAYSRGTNRREFLAANAFALAAAGLALVLLLFFGAVAGGNEQHVLSLSQMAQARMSVLIFVSLMAFIWLAGRPKEHSDFSRAFFMVHRAFFVALLYSLTVWGGSAGVAGAVQALLYRSMSYKVYLVLGTLSGFLGFTIFAGYFPSFKPGEQAERRAAVQTHPRFVEVLFGFIMLPIMLALSLVLLLWAGKTVLTGAHPEFSGLAAIAAWYSLGGVWLHIMTGGYDSAPARLYQRAYPICSLLILGFEARSLIAQLFASGLKDEEYFFGLIWVVALAAAVLLLVYRQKKYPQIVAVVCAAAVFCVLPGVNWRDWPVRAQTQRLEGLVTQAGILKDGALSPAVFEPGEQTRIDITDAVYFLRRQSEVKLPEWYPERLADYNVFEKTLGFEPTWRRAEGLPPAKTDILATYLWAGSAALDVGEYDSAVMLMRFHDKYGIASGEIEGQRGSYEIFWERGERQRTPPILTVMLEGQEVLHLDTKPFVDKLLESYPPGSRHDYTEIPAQELCVTAESGQVKVMLVIDNLNVTLDTRRDEISYWVDPAVLYFLEK